MTNFAKLNANAQAEIVQFTDNAGTNANGKPNSTLIEFCQDLQNTSGFVAFLNSHTIYAEGFLGYRNTPNHNYKAEDYEVLTDEISNLGLNQTLADMIGSWLDHATDATTRNGYYKKGKIFTYFS